MYLLATFRHTDQASGELPPALEARVPGLQHAANRFFWLRAQGVGANPTTVLPKAWRDSTLGPVTWQ